MREHDDAKRVIGNCSSSDSIASRTIFDVCKITDSVFVSLLNGVSRYCEKLPTERFTNFPAGRTSHTAEGKDCRLLCGAWAASQYQRAWSDSRTLNRFL